MFYISTLQELTARARSAFRSYLPGSDAWLWPNNINPTAKVIGGMASEVFGFADYIQRQKFAGTADGENLDLHGQEYGLSRRPAASAAGAIAISDSGPLTVAAGAVFERADGVQYIALNGASIGGAGTLPVDVVAALDGKAGNAEAATSLAIVSGVTGTTPLAEVGAAGIVFGADVEADGPEWTSDLGTFRGRILFRKRNPPHGGNAADYVAWSASQSGVTRVYVERLWNGPGTVRVFVLMDDLYANGIAASGDIERIAQFIETERPAGAIVTVAAPAPLTVNIQIGGLTPDTSAVREAVLAELRAMFRRQSRVAGNDTVHGGMPFLATPAVFSRSWVWQAVANACGEQSHIVNVPASDTALIAGQIAVLGAVTFVS